MIQAVSSSKVSNSKGAFHKYQENGNYMNGKIGNSVDTFSKSKNISFKGNLVEGAREITKKVAKELPAVKKPLFAAVSDLIHIVGDGQDVIRIPLEDISVAKETILDANNIIVPHITDLATDALKEGLSTSGHEAVGVIAEEASNHGVQEAGHGLLENLKEFVHEIITS